MAGRKRGRAVKKMMSQAKGKTAKRAGRPLLYDSPLDCKVMVRIDEEQGEAFSAYCRAAGVKVAAFLREESLESSDLGHLGVGVEALLGQAGAALDRAGERAIMVKYTKQQHRALKAFCVERGFTLSSYVRERGLVRIKRSDLGLAGRDLQQLESMGVAGAGRAMRNLSGGR